jgi:ribosomal protein S27E
VQASAQHPQRAPDGAPLHYERHRPFLRLRCGECGHDKLLAFSCKRRGFCPSCGARRMSQTAAHLVDHVIPHVPVRQWALSLSQETHPK